MKSKTLLAVIPFLLAPLLVSSTASAVVAPPPTLHFTSNEHGAYATTQALGFRGHDTTMSTWAVNRIPAGSKALVWVGLPKTRASAQVSPAFKAFVAANHANPKLYGFYLTDEPLDGTDAPAIRAYSDYIHAHAPGKKAFITVLDKPGRYFAYRPAATHLDLLGLDPYPVALGVLRTNKIPEAFAHARAAGIPVANIVPIFQTFGDSYYTAPTAAQLRYMVAQWAARVPHPQMDYAYSWSTQGTSLKAALATRADWRSIMGAHNR